jgi:hypothetical protein
MKQRIESLDNFINEDNEFTNLSVNEGEINYNKDKYALVLCGGSLGDRCGFHLFVGRNMATVLSTSDDKESLVEDKKRRNKQLTPGEKSYYGMSYKVVEITPSVIKMIDYLKAQQDKDKVEEVE